MRPEGSKQAPGAISEPRPTNKPRRLQTSLLEPFPNRLCKSRPKINTPRKHAVKIAFQLIKIRNPWHAMSILQVNLHVIWAPWETKQMPMISATAQNDHIMWEGCQKRYLPPPAKHPWGQGPKVLIKTRTLGRRLYPETSIIWPLVGKLTDITTILPNKLRASKKTNPEILE